MQLLGANDGTGASQRRDPGLAALAIDHERMGGRGLGAAQVDLVLDQPAVDLGLAQDLEERPLIELASPAVRAV